ncbi:MAG: bifunctional folylpolyglutamate synthase/dihydrofolate synthase [Oscillospiraceae bacterium]|nr:bifunctional folylpolyglutamate synthase/dihydrofolate synthase [Oscillospiraceae bacterium]MDD4414586.1 bifunctional folylpolyglutamate synthase/dihydrofolate synthase [Oscillospiraceae bacterium]
MEYTKAVEYIDTLKSGGIKPGLERIKRILRLRGNPERKLKFIHVAGTNGKGSTARMIQSMLTAGGYKTGLYSSPCVTGLRDTITVDGTSISEEDFSDITCLLRSHQSDMGGAGEMSEFELTTALAFIYFEKQNTDICVVECGLGGQDDATNVIPPPLAAVITPVSSDHAALLGMTIAQITANKCGIIKPPCAVITSPAQDGDGLAVIMETAARHGLTVRIPSVGSAPVKSLALGSTEFIYDDMNIYLPLTGLFQRDNALTAIETVSAVEQAGFPVSKQHIIDGLRTAEMPCRQEVIRSSPLIMVDGAHNPHGVAALARTLSLHSLNGLTLVVGMLADKDVAGCMSLLTPFCRRAVCCTPDNPRALPASDLAQILHNVATELVVEIADSAAAALQLAQSDAQAPLLITGSFYLAAPLRRLLIV